MNLCDIYIAVSRGEGFGLPLVEAQLCGKMIITHGSTSTSELIAENITGLKADYHVTSQGESRADITSLAEKIELAVSDSQLREKLSANARRIAIERFGKKEIATQLMHYIKEFI
jgi:glycosyltransferase involved in cell wall biosynthesis